MDRAGPPSSIPAPPCPPADEGQALRKIVRPPLLLTKLLKYSLAAKDLGLRGEGG